MSIGSTDNPTSILDRKDVGNSRWSDPLGGADMPSTGGRDNLFLRASFLLAMAREQMLLARERAELLQRRDRKTDRILAVAGTAGLACGTVFVTSTTVSQSCLILVQTLMVAIVALPLKRLYFRGDVAASGGQRINDLNAARAGALSSTLSCLVDALAVAQKRDPASSDQLSMLGNLLTDIERDLPGKAAGIVDKDPARKSLRRHRRIIPRQRRVMVHTSDGRKLIGNIKDLSRSGVALSERLPRVESGEHVIIGRQPATVVRVWDRGVALAFVSELDAATFDENFTF